MIRYKWKKRKILTFTGYLWCDDASLERMPGGHIIITTHIHDIMDDIINKKVIVIDATVRSIWNDWIDEKYLPYGIILLEMMCIDRSNMDY